MMSATRTALPAAADMWTKAEKKDFQACLLHLSALKTGGDHRSDKGFCEVGEEHKHWMRNHREASARKGDSMKFQKCNRDHATEMNGMPAQFHAAFDRCMREAYGLSQPNH
jgi:hypothetical protein